MKTRPILLLIIASFLAVIAIRESAIGQLNCSGGCSTFTGPLSTTSTSTLTGNVGIGTAPVASPTALVVSGLTGANSGAIKLLGNRTAYGTITGLFNTTAGGSTSADNLSISVDSGYIDLASGGGTNLRITHAGLLQFGGFTISPPQVFSNTAVSTSIGTTATQTYFSLNANIPASALMAGKTVTMDIVGIYNGNATDTGILGLAACKVSGCGSGVVVQWGTSAAATFLGVTNDYFTMHTQSTIYTVGASGTVDTQGEARWYSSTTGDIKGQITNTTTIAIDTTVAEFLTPFVKFSTASASDSIKITGFKVVVQ